MEKQEYLVQYERLKKQFDEATGILQAIGDATRQHIILAMFELPCQTKGGARVGEITQKTHLSRPAVSHHLKILKDAGIIKMRRQGTKNYYYLSAEHEALKMLQDLFGNVIELSQKINDEGEKLK